MSRTQLQTLPVLVALIVLVAACGPLSYDLTVRVTETDGTAIPQASVSLLGLRDAQTTNQAGETVWTDLGTDTAVLFIAAGGYISYAAQLELKRGHNEIVVQLERAPIDPDVLGP